MASNTIDPDIMEQARETAAAYHNWSLGRTLNHSTAELAQRIAAAMQSIRDRGRAVLSGGENV